MIENQQPTEPARTKNPHFDGRFLSRAPYQLAQLFRQMPEYFPVDEPVGEDNYFLADAASRYADVALQTVLSGLEAIGWLMYAATSNVETTPGEHTLADLGLLIRHLAVEAEFLVETDQECTDLVKKEDARRQQEGGAK